jgi:uncharacterized protein YjbJ (UPF0337 family)
LAAAVGDIRVGARADGAREIKSTWGQNKMKTSVENKIEGEFHEVKGKIKEETGKLADKPDLEAEGTVEKVAGKIQKKFGQVQKAIRKD